MVLIAGCVTANFCVVGKCVPHLRDSTARHSPIGWQMEIGGGHHGNVADCDAIAVVRVRRHHTTIGGCATRRHERRAGIGERREGGEAEEAQ